MTWNLILALAIAICFADLVAAALRRVASAGLLLVARRSPGLQAAMRESLAADAALAAKLKPTAHLDDLAEGHEPVVCGEGGHYRATCACGEEFGGFRSGAAAALAWAEHVAAIARGSWEGDPPAPRHAPDMLERGW